MKISVSIILLLSVSIGIVQTQNQNLDYTKRGLPEGAVVLIGKGVLTGPVVISPESSRFAVPTSVGIWLYDLDTYQEIGILAAHQTVWSSLVFSPDGRTLATGYRDGRIQLWDTVTGNSKGMLTKHIGSVIKLFFSSDGEQLISVGSSWSDDKNIHLWNAKTGKYITTLTDMVEYNVAFSFADNVLAIIRSKGIELWDIKTRKQNTFITDERETFRFADIMTFSPNGEILAFSSEQDIYLWNTENKKIMSTLIGHISNIRHLKFSPDSKVLASACAKNAGQGTSIWLWDVETGQYIATLLGYTGGVHSFVFSPDSKILASTSDDLTIRLWDVNTGQHKNSLTGHNTELFSIEFAPDGETLLARDWDARVHTWNLRTGEYKNIFTAQTSLRTTFYPTNEYWNVAWNSPVVFSLDGQTYRCANADNTIWVWDTKTNKLKKKLSGYTFKTIGVILSQDSQTVANAGMNNTIHLWNLNTGHLQTTLKTEIDEIRPMAFSPDGNLLATRSKNNIQLWNTKADRNYVVLKRALLNQSLRFIGHIQDHASLEYQMYLKNIARFIRNNEKRSEQYRATLVGHTGHVASVAFSPDGKLLASAGSWNNITRQYDTSIRIWDLKTEQSDTILNGHTSGIRCLCFSPDGKILASGSQDKTVRLWNMSTQKTVSNLTGHPTVVFCLAFSPNGKILASASGDLECTIHLWDVLSGQLKTKLNGHKRYIKYLTFSPDGKLLASVSIDGTILIWDMERINK